MKDQLTATLFTQAPTARLWNINTCRLLGIVFLINFIVNYHLINQDKNILLQYCYKYKWDERHGENSQINIFFWIFVKGEIKMESFYPDSRDKSSFGSLGHFHKATKKKKLCASNFHLNSTAWLKREQWRERNSCLIYHQKYLGLCSFPFYMSSENLSRIKKKKKMEEVQLNS